MRRQEELQKRQRVAAERAARAAQPEKPLSLPGPSHKGKDVAGTSAPPTPEERAKRITAKEAALEARREHEAMLRERERQRIAQLAQQAELASIGTKISSGG